MTRATSPRLAAGLLAFSFASALASAASAQSTIEQPTEHPSYWMELEPHLGLGWINPPGSGSGNGFGLGLQASFVLVDPGFIPDLNNTVALGVAIDWLNYSREHGDSTTRYFWIPVVLQWNFYIGGGWSVFGEPGLAPRFMNHGSDSLDFILRLGARWHFTKTTSLTLRVGYPTMSVGISMLF